MKCKCSFIRSSRKFQWQFQKPAWQISKILLIFSLKISFHISSYIAANVKDVIRAICAMLTVLTRSLWQLHYRWVKCGWYPTLLPTFYPLSHLHPASPHFTLNWNPNHSSNKPLVCIRSKMLLSKCLKHWILMFTAHKLLCHYNCNIWLL